jgi:hypothetical protein
LFCYVLKYWMDMTFMLNMPFMIDMTIMPWQDFCIDHTFH